MSDPETPQDDAEPRSDEAARPHAEGRAARRPRAAEAVAVDAASGDEDEDDAVDDGAPAAATAVAAKKKPARRLPVWSLVLIGLVLGVFVMFGFRFVQDLRDRPGHGMTMSAKASATRKPWIDDGYVEIVPPIRMPSNLSGRDRIEVWLKIPDGKKLSAKYLEAQKRWTLVYPPGTIADRLEMPDGEHVVDVRGTELDLEGGGETFHVYRPHNTAMRGYHWKRDNAEQQEEATRVLLAHATHFENAKQRELDSLKSNNGCGPCHVHEREVDRKQLKNRPNRGTDSAGFFVPDTMFFDRAPLEAHRPREMNVDDPFISFHCFDEDGKESGEVVWTQRQDSTKWPTCADKTVPIGVVDVPAGLKANEVHTTRLCKSRKALYDRMDDIAKKAFADAFTACGISG